MKRFFFLWLNVSLTCIASGQTESLLFQPSYLDAVKEKMQQKWPANNTVNIVFHGHSVPAGYFITPNVNSLQSYPFLLLKSLKEEFSFAVINVIVTAKGGENSVQGNQRFKKDVLIHKPDILFIDYALNDRNIGLSKAKKAWKQMIELALKRNIKVILFTPTPDLTENILDPESPLAKHASQIRELAYSYKIGLVDSYASFKTLALKGAKLQEYMAQSNHPNAKGHELVVNEILKYFK